MTIGPAVDLRPAPLPARIVLEGRDVRVVALDPAAHGDALFESTGPFPLRAAFDAAVRRWSDSKDPFFYAIVDRASGLALGRAALMRIEPTHRVIEVGSILYSPRLQRTRGATEAMYLLARYVFEELGYRRYEWKCNALNEASRAAAIRLGFTFEGVFRQHMIVKDRNRDTAWYSIIDAEWPARKARLERWLSLENFDAEGRQRTPLSAIALA
ncbi:MAG: GNAT family N-acetyltransferase [Acidobacteria bacterium]|nr:MAG: GNAT family N-acetyltransferase [Acidobacteriota bacterium]